MPKSYKTTKKHFKLFKKECRYWLDQFDLGSWRVEIWHENNKDEAGRAWMFANWKGRSADLGLSVDFGKDKITTKQVSRSAFHEVCELFMFLLRIYGETNANPAQMDEVTCHLHAIIRRLEKAIWEPYWRKHHA